MVSFHFPSGLLLLPCCCCDCSCLVLAEAMLCSCPYRTLCDHSSAVSADARLMQILCYYTRIENAPSRERVDVLMLYEHMFFFAARQGSCSRAAGVINCLSDVIEDASSDENANSRNTLQREHMHRHFSFHTTFPAFRCSFQNLSQANDTTTQFPASSPPVAIK